MERYFAFGVGRLLKRQNQHRNMQRLMKKKENFVRSALILTQKKGANNEKIN